MAYPEVVTREEWLAARKRLLATEKEHTRSRDALNAERRRLPMVRIGKEYVFDGPEGKVTLAGLFGYLSLKPEDGANVSGHRVRGTARN